MDFPEPVCQSCVSAFSPDLVPYALSCQHLVCSDCVQAIEDLCPVQDCQKPVRFRETFPALDLLDVLLQMRNGLLPCQQWTGLNKEKLRCRYTLQGLVCQHPEPLCPFSHEFPKWYFRDAWTCRRCGATSVGHTCKCGSLRI